MISPLVSVIIPAYNSEKCISEALDSVFAQTYRPVEIIIVDDGSTDRTARVIRDYQTCKTEESNEDDVNLLYFYQQNAGPSKARNIGVKMASGEYAAFLDADDVWILDKLEKQMRLFMEDQTIDVVFSDAKVSRTLNCKTEEFTVFSKHKLDRTFFGHEYIVVNPLEKLLNINFMLTPSVIIKKACFKNGFFFNESVRYAEDWELWLQMALHFKFGYIKDVCVNVFDDGDGLCSHAADMVLSRVIILEKFIKENAEYAVEQIAKKKLSILVRDAYKWAGYYFMRNGNNKLARDYYIKALHQSFELKTTLYLLRSFVTLSKNLA